MTHNAPSLRQISTTISDNNGVSRQHSKCLPSTMSSLHTVLSSLVATCILFTPSMKRSSNTPRCVRNSHHAAHSSTCTQIQPRRQITRVTTPFSTIPASSTLDYFFHGRQIFSTIPVLLFDFDAANRLRIQDLCVKLNSQPSTGLYTYCNSTTS